MLPVDFHKEMQALKEAAHQKAKQDEYDAYKKGLYSVMTSDAILGYKAFQFVYKDNADRAQVEFEKLGFTVTRTESQRKIHIVTPKW